MALGLGLGTAACSLLWCLSLALTISELHRIGDGPAPPFYPGIIFLVGAVLTLPPGLVCTLSAILLVGFWRCKLAWLSLLSFLPNYFIGVLLGELWAWCGGYY